MIDFHSRLFTRIMSRNREVYLLKIITLAVAFASAILIVLFSLNEFSFDRFHNDSDHVFRMLKRNNAESFSGNRLSAKIPQDVFTQVKRKYKDSLLVSRVRIMNKISVCATDKKLHYDQKMHAVDPEITDIFSFEILDGDLQNFSNINEATVLLSARSAKAYTGTVYAAGQKIKVYTLTDTVALSIAAVFKDFPQNSHEDFNALIRFDEPVLTALHFNPGESGVYGRTKQEFPNQYQHLENESTRERQTTYSLQPLPDLYFGPRVLGEEAKHGDHYSIIILLCITGLIIFLSLSSFVNLTTITLPYRSKELAIKKLAGTNQTTLLLGFLKESFMLVVFSLAIGLLMLIALSTYIDSTLNLKIVPLILGFDIRLIIITTILLTMLTIPPVFMTVRFIKATPNRLLSSDTITFPKLKQFITFLQLGISIFLIIASVVVRRQINYSLVKEPGQNHDQIVFLNSPAGITNEGVRNLRNGWRQYNANILDVMAVSQLPDRFTSREIGSEFYQLQVDVGFREFFGLKMVEGYWFGPNSTETDIITNRSGKERMTEKHLTFIGVSEDFSEAFNQPEKPVKITLGKDYQYNWLCVRVLEVDIRRTVMQLSRNLSYRGEIAHVNYLDPNFKSWVDYQDRLNTLSAILAIISAVLSCFAIYGLSVSLVRDKLKEIAVHKLFGAHTAHITYLLVREFARQMIMALIVFAPIAYILLNELLRTFVFSTKFMWADPLYPIAYCIFVICTICTFQALSLNRSDFSSALKGQ